MYASMSCLMFYVSTRIFFCFCFKIYYLASYFCTSTMQSVYGRLDVCFHTLSHNILCIHTNIFLCLCFKISCFHLTRIMHTIDFFFLPPTCVLPHCTHFATASQCVCVCIPSPALASHFVYSGLLLPLPMEAIFGGIQQLKGMSHRTFRASMEGRRLQWWWWWGGGGGVMKDK